MKKFVSAFYRLICLQYFIVLSWALSAQDIPVVSSKDILNQRQEVFNQINALENPYEDSLWYQGRIYEFELKSKTGTPYFLNIGMMDGSLTYNKKLHEELNLSYNLIMDELILWRIGSVGESIPIVLNKYLMDRFTLKHNGNDYHFRLHTEMKPIHDQLKEGFYEVISDDELRMFVRHNKELAYDGTDRKYSYGYEKQVYLILDEKMYAINNKRDYLNAFHDHKKALRKYMSQANINFNKSGTQDLFELCTYSKSILHQ